MLGDFLQVLAKTEYSLLFNSVCVKASLVSKVLKQEEVVNSKSTIWCTFQMKIDWLKNKLTQKRRADILSENQKKITYWITYAVHAVSSEHSRVFFMTSITFRDFLENFLELFRILSARLYPGCEMNKHKHQNKWKELFFGYRRQCKMTDGKCPGIHPSELMYAHTRYIFKYSF